jgi:SAM-dependent methyltransferase
MSELTQSEQTTLDSYNRVAGLWSADHWTKNFWSENLDYFNELLPSGRLLEIGCGAGRDAQDLIKLGYDYQGVDISGELIKEAHKNNPGAEFNEASLYDLDFEQPFDGFWCAAVLIHLPKGRINEALGAIKRNMKAKAIGFIAIKEGEGEKLEVRPELDNAKFLFSYYQDDEFQNILSKNNFEVLRQGYMPMSERTKWLTYHVKAR